MLEKLFNIKKRFFVKELKMTQANIWSLEFTKFASMVKRERIRLQYDQSVDALGRIEQQLEQDKRNQELKDQKKAVEEQVKTLKAIIDEVESVMNGEGGVNKSLESLIEKRENIKNFIKHSC